MSTMVRFLKRRQLPSAVAETKFLFDQRITIVTIGHQLKSEGGGGVTMGKKKPYMAVFDAFDWLSLNENTKNQ